jgi:hypothetical protein
MAIEPGQVARYIWIIVGINNGDGQAAAVVRELTKAIKRLNFPGDIARKQGARFQLLNTQNAVAPSPQIRLTERKARLSRRVEHLRCLR